MLRFVTRRTGFRAALAAATFLAVASAVAQTIPPRPDIPDLFDPDHRLPKPDLAAVKTIRFLTTDDFPPFHFTTADGTLTGFDVDLARAICADLKIACTIQARRFDQLVGEIKAGHDDALIAAVANNPATRSDLDFTAPYYTTPARFATRLQSKPDAKGPVGAMAPDALADRAIGVEGGTAHEAYLKAFFRRPCSVPTATSPTFGRRLATARSKPSSATASACLSGSTERTRRAAAGFAAARFTESRYFGNGVSIAVGKGNDALREVLDYELDALTARRHLRRPLPQIFPDRLLLADTSIDVAARRLATHEPIEILAVLGVKQLVTVPCEVALGRGELATLGIEPRQLVAAPKIEGGVAGRLRPDMDGERQRTPRREAARDGDEAIPLGARKREGRKRTAAGLVP